MRVRVRCSVSVTGRVWVRVSLNPGLSPLYQASLVVVVRFRFPNQLPFTTAPFGTSQFDVPASARSSSPVSVDDPNYGVTVESIQEDTTPGAKVHMPGHPDADAEGYVTMSNVSRTNELVDLLDARRVFEANATVFQSAKQLLRKSLEL